MRRFTIVSLTTLLLAVVLAAQDSTFWQYAHPNAKALIGIDVQRVRTSQMAAQLRSQFQTVNLPAVPGLEFLKWVDRVMISSPGVKTPGTTQEPPVLIAVQGRFDPAELKRAFRNGGAKPQTFNNVTIYRPQGKENSDFGFAPLDAHTLLIGDVKSIFDTIERLEHPPAASQPTPIMLRAREMDSKYDFWAILQMPPAAMSRAHVPFADAFENVKGLEAGIAARDGFAFEMRLEALTEAAAKDIYAQTVRLIRLAAKDKENHPEWAGLGKKLKTSIDRSYVQFSLALNRQDVLRIAKLRAAKRLPTPQTAAISIARPDIAGHIPHRQEPARQVIRIEGLDEGTREIPYGPSHP